MIKVDYSKYSIEELMDVKDNIDPESPNYTKLQEELASRKNKIDEHNDALESKALNIYEDRVKIIGYFQILGAVVITVVLARTILVGSISMIGVIIGIAFIFLNIIAGYTAIKQMYDKYWISIANQTLQVPSFALGGLEVNYAGIGGFLASIGINDNLRLGFGPTFSPGFTLINYECMIPTQYFAIDLMALFFIIALTTVQEKKGYNSLEAEEQY